MASSKIANCSLSDTTDKLLGLKILDMTSDIQSDITDDITDDMVSIVSEEYADSEIEHSSESAFAELNKIQIEYRAAAEKYYAQIAFSSKKRPHKFTNDMLLIQQNHTNFINSVYNEWASKMKRNNNKIVRSETRRFDKKEEKYKQSKMGNLSAFPQKKSGFNRYAVMSSELISVLNNMSSENVLIALNNSKYKNVTYPFKVNHGNVQISLIAMINLIRTTAEITISNDSTHPFSLLCNDTSYEQNRLNPNLEYIKHQSLIALLKEHFTFPESSQIPLSILSPSPITTKSTLCR
jgi:hypothetical protein